MASKSLTEVTDRTTTARSLKALRAFAGMSAKDLSECSSVPLATLQSIESERRPCNAFQLALISCATGVDPRGFIKGELREWDGQTPYSPSTITRWRDKRDVLPKQKLEGILEALQTEQKQTVKRLKRQDLLLYVSFAAAIYEQAMTHESFLELSHSMTSPGSE